MNRVLSAIVAFEEELRYTAPAEYKAVFLKNLVLLMNREVKFVA
jgi:hypothetical protein